MKRKSLEKKKEREKRKKERAAQQVKINKIRKFRWSVIDSPKSVGRVGGDRGRMGGRQ